MQIRHARPEDAPMLAGIHVAAWAETYHGLLPDTEIARYDHELRTRQWARQIATGTSRIRLAPGLGFAQVGPQRDPALAARGYRDELLALYLLGAAQGRGLGRALFAAALGPRPDPMSALVLDGNARACRFYERSGARHADTLSETVDGVDIRDRLYLWDAGPSL